MAEALFDSPLGPLFAVASDAGLQRLEFVRGTSRKAGSEPLAISEADTPAQRVLFETQRQLSEYFDGDRHDFDLPLDFEGTEFRKRVWQAIAAIPYGKTDSYAGVAVAAGAPGAYRAAGSACGANPIAVIVPCHRVVGSDNALHGYGGGMDVKTWLLQLEGSLAGLKGAQGSFALT